jgi:predicted transcriptional regulator
MQDREVLITLTADVVAAHVSNNDVAADQLPGLISSIYQAFSSLGVEPALTEVKSEPAVSIRASIKPDYVACLECGKKLQMLKRHLSADHGISVEEYRQRWELAADYPLVAPNYTTKRRDLAKSIGLGRKPKSTSKSAPAGSAGSVSTKPKSSRPIGSRKLSLRFEKEAADGSN